MLSIPLFFYTTIGVVLFLVEKAMGLFLRSLRAVATHRLWLSLLGWTVPKDRHSRELASKGVVFFFRGPLLVQLPV